MHFSGDMLDTYKTASRRVVDTAGWQSSTAHLQRKRVGNSQLLHHRVEERLHGGVGLMERQEMQDQQLCVYLNTGI